ncbi:hypothetical protein ABZ820_24905 [Streptomyces diacarni]|uniref:hypothetical protein n=1 Tax=Streptomyces diacarni TaxID=2800381 RepID=UPI0033FB77F3
MITKELIGPRPIFSDGLADRLGSGGTTYPWLRHLPAAQQRFAVKDPPQPVMPDGDAAGLGDLNETAQVLRV